MKREGPTLVLTENVTKRVLKLESVPTKYDADVHPIQGNRLSLSLTSCHQQCKESLLSNKLILQKLRNKTLVVMLQFNKLRLLLEF